MKNKLDWKKNYKTFRDCRECKHLIKQEFYNLIFEDYFNVVNLICDLAGKEYDGVKRNKDCFESP